MANAKALSISLYLLVVLYIGMIITNLEVLVITVFLFGTSIFISLNMKYQYLAVLIGSLFPLGFGRVFGGIEITLIAIAGPMMLVGLLLRRKKWILKPHTSVAIKVYYGMITLVIALIASYVRNPAGTKSLFGGIGDSYGMRLYFEAAVCILVFLLTVWAMKTELWESFQLIKVVMLMSTIIGILRVINYLGYIQVPFFTGTLKYLQYTGEISSFTEYSRRIGGLDLPAGFSIISAYLLYSNGIAKIQSAICLILGVFLLVFSGGRSAFIGLGLAAFTAIALKEKKTSWQVVIPIAIAYYLLSSLSFGYDQSLVESQMQRILRYQNLAEEQTHRIDGYTYLLEAVRENPLLGKGITSIDYGSEATIAATGGHGGFISIIGLFGALGVIFLILSYINIVKYAIIMLIKIKNRHPCCGMSLMIKFGVYSLIFVGSILMVGGTGYSSPYLYLFIGVLTGAIEKERQHEYAR